MVNVHLISLAADKLTVVRSCLCVHTCLCVCVNTSSFVFACNGLSIIVHSYAYATVKSFA